MAEREAADGAASIRWIVMGVSGCGKSTVAALLAARLGVARIEGDAYHAPASLEKMRAGIPLEDEDRQEWLLRLQHLLAAARERGEGAVLSCSALKRRYRELLRGGDQDLLFIHLDGAPELIAARMQHRSGHFMPAALLASQYRDLEPLQEDEQGVRLDVVNPPEVLVEQALQWWRSRG